MRILICGLGSIGQRHIRILRKFYKKKLRLFSLQDSKKKFILDDNFKVKKTQSVAKHYEIKIIKLKDIKKYKIKIAYICTPPASHINLAEKLAKLNCNLFIEKPISKDAEKLKKILKIIKQKKLITHIGYQLRFHPAVKKIKALIKKNLLGKILGGTFYFGEYPGNVRAYEDFAKSHMAKKKHGGGVLLSLSHHLDLAFYFFGNLKSKYKHIKNTRNFNIQAEDSFKGIFLTDNNADLQFNLNFLDAEQNNFIILNFKKGTIFWDYYNKKLKISFIDKKKKKEYFYNNFNRNRMFEAQTKFFISKIKNSRFDTKSFESSSQIIRLIEKVKKNIK